MRIGNRAAVQEQLDVYGGEVMGAIQFAWRIGKYDPTPLWGTIRQMLDWVVRHWHNRDSGLWEVRGGGVRHFVYSKAMMWFALDCGIEIAEEMRLPGDLAGWRRERGMIHEEVLDKDGATHWARSNSLTKTSNSMPRTCASRSSISSRGMTHG